MLSQDKRKEISLSYFRCIYNNGSWYQPDVVRELDVGGGGEEVLIADSPAEEALRKLRIAIYEDKWIPDDGVDPEPTGLQQVHLMGDSRALNALGRYLIAISESNLPEDRIDHFEPVKGAKHQEQVHLVVHHKFREDLNETIRVGSVQETEIRKDNDIS